MNEVLTGSKRATAGLGKALQDMRSVRALVIDANLTARSILRSMLIDLGLQADHIRQVSRYNEARGEIEYHRYDLILCEHHFSETQQTGADLLDEVRAGNHLPFSTVVVMVVSRSLALMEAFPGAISKRKLSRIGRVLLLLSTPLMA